MQKKKLITIIVIIAVIILAYFILAKKNPETPEDVAKCIGEKATLYVKLGCPHCEAQEEMFGSNAKYLNIIDCFFEHDKCYGIEYVPTWIIDGKKIQGVQSIEKLQQLTGCE